MITAAQATHLVALLGDGEELFAHLAAQLLGETTLPDEDRAAVAALAWRHMQGDPAWRRSRLEREIASRAEHAGARWPRYEAHRLDCVTESTAAGQDLDDEDELEARAAAQWREMADLLLQRMTLSYYTAIRLATLVGNVTERPVWRLTPVMDGRTPEECRQKAGEMHHWRSDYWQRLSLPCARLDCRCRVTALTVKQAAEALVEQR